MKYGNQLGSFLANPSNDSKSAHKFLELLWVVSEQKFAKLWNATLNTFGDTAMN